MILACQTLVFCLVLNHFKDHRILLLAKSWLMDDIHIPVR